MFKVGEKVRCIDAIGGLVNGQVYETIKGPSDDYVYVSGRGQIDNGFFPYRFQLVEVPDYLSACNALPFPAPLPSSDNAVWDYEGRKCEGVKEKGNGTLWICVGGIDRSASRVYSGTRYRSGWVWDSIQAAKDGLGGEYVAYAIYDFPVDSDGVALDPVKLGEMGYTVYHRKTELGDWCASWGPLSQTQRWVDVTNKTCLSAWQACARHFLGEKK